MKPLRILLAAAAIAAAALTGHFAALVPELQAATPNVPVGAGQVAVFPFQISGEWTTTTTSVAKWALPFACQAIGASATARASGGSSPTLTVDVLEAGTSILSAPISVTAGTVAEGTISDAALADEAVMTLDLAIGGTTPTWNDITVLLTCARK